MEKTTRRGRGVIVVAGGILTMLMLAMIAISTPQGQSMLQTVNSGGLSLNPSTMTTQSMSQCPFGEGNCNMFSMPER